MKDAGGRKKDSADAKCKTKRRPKAPGWNRSALRCVLVLFDIVVADLVVAIRLNVGTIAAEVISDILAGILHIIRDVAAGIFHVAEGVLNFAFSLFARALGFLFFVAGHFAELLLRFA